MAEIWNYETIKELLYAPGLGHYFTYGLLAARKVNSAWEPVEFIHDVTTDYLLVKKWRSCSTATSCIPSTFETRSRICFHKFGDKKTQHSPFRVLGFSI